MNIFPAVPFQTNTELKQCFQLFDLCNIEGYHFDIMDGKFVENRMGSIELINQARLDTKKVFWVHLMVQNPLEYITQLKLNPNDIISFHYESTTEWHHCITQIHAKKCIASIAINPKTSFEQIKPLLDHSEFSLEKTGLLIMSVNPGKSGQPFIPETLQKLQLIQEYRLSTQQNFILAMDGGISAQTMPSLLPYLVDQAAIGSAIFQAQDKLSSLKTMLQLAEIKT